MTLPASDDDLLVLLADAPAEQLPELVAEARAAGRDVSVFVCGGPRPVCHRCGARAVQRCDAAGPDGRACGRPLCSTHLRGTRCAQHAPETSNPNMPRPPRRGSR